MGAIFRTSVRKLFPVLPPEAQRSHRNRFAPAFLAVFIAILVSGPANKFKRLVRPVFRSLKGE